jgi:glycosyltransferase involved in cell wall biosynthesis
MNTNIKISIIIPVHNTEKYLPKCLDSILNQTVEEIEIIIVNDCSTDDSKKIILKYLDLFHSVIFIDLDTNIGPGATKNRGVDVATGNYLTFVDSDDWIEKDFLEKLVEEIKFSEPDVICTGINHVNENSELIFQEEIHHSRTELDKVTSLKYLFTDTKIKAFLPTKIFKLALFENFLISENRLFEDTASTHLLFNKANKIILAPISSYNYLRRNNSITNNPDIQHLYTSKRDYYLSLNERVEFCEKNIKSDIETLNACYNSAIIMGFNFIYFSFYHEIINKNLILNVIKNLKNYPVNTNNSLPNNSKILYNLLRINELLFYTFLKYYFQTKIKFIQLFQMNTSTLKGSHST